MFAATTTIQYEWDFPASLPANIEAILRATGPRPPVAANHWFLGTRAALAPRNHSAVYGYTLRSTGEDLVASVYNCHRKGHSGAGGKHQDHRGVIVLTGPSFAAPTIVARVGHGVFRPWLGLDAQGNDIWGMGGDFVDRVAGPGAARGPRARAPAPVARVVAPVVAAPVVPVVAASVVLVVPAAAAPATNDEKLAAAVEKAMRMGEEAMERLEEEEDEVRQNELAAMVEWALEVAEEAAAMRDD